MPLSLILAVDDAGAIGLRGGLPWELTEDRAHFEERTRGRAVIMGRRTWDEVGRPLEGRRNIVVSSQLSPPAGVRVTATLDEAIAAARETDPDPFVIGGAGLFREAVALASTVWLTEVPGVHEADAYFILEPGARVRDALIARGFVVAEERAGDLGVRFLRLEHPARSAPSGGDEPGGAREP